HSLDPSLRTALHAIELKLMDTKAKFNGDRTKSRRNELAYPGFTARLRTMISGALAGPTGTHRRQYDVIVNEYKEALRRLKQIVNVDMPALNRKLNKAGAPWTPGRSLPRIK
ncbi:MAG: hypothetical protein VCA38_13725, partial [Roseibacillus sp.]